MVKKGTTCSWPGCEKATSKNYYWWFCPDHWRVIGREERQEMQMAVGKAVRHSEEHLLEGRIMTNILSSIGVGWPSQDQGDTAE